MSRYRLLRSILLGGSAAFVATQALAQQARDFDIAQGDLQAALDAYIRQTGTQLIYVAGKVQGVHTDGVHGEMDQSTALDRILKGTPFAEQTDPSGAIAIVDRVRVAQTEPRRAPSASSSVETVVVTAQKKAEDIQQVPIAITALSQQQLTERQIAGGPDLLKSVPNMDFTKTNFSGYNIELRGIGTQAISVTTDPAVAVAFNDTPFIRNHFFEQEFFDLQDVEVLLGPQGTLYGRNATAGVVNLKSALPTDQYEAMLSADLGNYSNRRLEAMINIPIAGDKLDIRIAGEWTKRDGYTEDTTLNTPVDGRDLWSGRVTIGWNPSSNFHSDFVWEHFSEDDDRLRSGKQLCNTQPPVTNVSGQVGSYTFNQAVPPPGGAGFENDGGGALTFGQNFTSQGCQAGSLYSPSAFGVPYGPSLPYIIAAASTGAINPGADPYASTTQSTNLRDIQSSLLPTYRARNDTVEYNATYKIDSALTLTSESGFNEDFLWSTEDYNRFDTAPGIFSGPSIAAALSYPPGDFVRQLYLPDPSVPGAAIFCDPQLGCSDRIVAEDLDEEHAWQMSQEFRLSSNFDGPVNFSVGANYLHYETEENYYVFANALTAFVYGTGDSRVLSDPTPETCLFTNNRFRNGYQPSNPLTGGGSAGSLCGYVDPNPIGSLDNDGHNYFLSQNPYTLNSYALFGELYYNITPSLKLTTGLRWTADEKHFVDIPSQLVDNGYGYSVSGIINQTWERPTGRAVLDWSPKVDFTDQTLLYLSYSHGYKAGGANPPGAIFPQYGGSNAGFVDHPLTFKPEYIEAFELGTKNTLLDGALTLNGDVFYYNYTGYQISEIVDRTAINNNYNAHVEGAEVTANWEPIPGLRFNFAGGWEDTAAASGDSGIDLMDRTAGMPGWMVVKPFPTAASNCIFPTYVVAAILQEQSMQGTTGGLGGPTSQACNVAYTEELDPATGRPYVANPSGTTSVGGIVPIPPGYPGFNPLSPAINNGEGFLKNLGGHQLPNAPPFTVSLGGAYSLPVSEDWVATLRGDFYWQADSWARIFNDNPYDRIHGYDTVNLSLILTSANGWQVMGYVKNVFNTAAITGDFLNSDDSGLTTNVFLTDPRLYGIRVTKHLDENDGFWGSDWSGAEWIKELFEDSDDGRPPLWIELGGQLEHITGQGAPFVPAFESKFAASPILLEKTTPTEVQRPPLFSAGEEATVSFEPADSDWIISAAVRYGRSGNKIDVRHQTNGLQPEQIVSGVPNNNGLFTQNKFVDSHVYHDESHSIMDFLAGKDVGLGLFGQQIDSVLSGGLRFAQFESHSSVDIRARPDLNFQQYNLGFEVKYEPYFQTYHAYENVSRKFRGAGPTVSWKGSTRVMDNDTAGGLDLDWGVNAAVLFGRQSTKVRHLQTGRYWPKGLEGGLYTNSYLVNPTAGGHTTRRDVEVPNLGGFAGISYRFQNAKISVGYRVDLFFGAIDGGIDKPRSETLNMGGPFATISFGLGG